jgi:hypothetical protein
MKLVTHQEGQGAYLDPKSIVEILNYQNDPAPTLYVSVCELGNCVCARHDIKAGEFIYRFTGPVIDFYETTTRGEYECMCLQYDYDRYIDTEAPGRFVNHSCEPNAGIVNDFDLVALQDIAAHAEITFDYSTTMDEDHYQMECLCRTPSCRGRVTDFKLVPPAIRLGYLSKGVVMSFIRQAITGQNVIH